MRTEMRKIGAVNETQVVWFYDRKKECVYETNYIYNRKKSVSKKQMIFITGKRVCLRNK